MTKQNNHSFLSSYVRGEALIGFWNGVSKALGGISAFLVISNLDVFKYGVYLLVLSFYSLVAGFFLSPLVEVVTNDINRFIGEGREDKAKKLFKEFFIFRGIIAIILSVGVFLGADLVSSFYGQDIADLFRIISPLFVIDFFYVSMRNLLQSRLRFGLTAFRPILYKIIKVILLFSFLAFSSINSKNILIAHVVATFFAGIAFVGPFIKIYKPWNTIKESSERILLNIIKTYGKWPIFSNFISQATTDIRPWLVKFFVNTEAVAVFNVAESLFGAVKAGFPVATLSTLIPREAKDKKRMGEILIRGTKYLTVLGIVLGVVGFFVVPPVVNIIFPHYKSSIPLFQILLLLFPTLSFRTMASTFLIVLRRQKFLFFINMTKNLISFVFPIAFLYFFGIWGMAMERIAISIVIGGLMYGYLLKREAHPSFWKVLISFDEKDKIFVKNLWERSLAFAKRSTFPRRKISSR